MQPSVKQYLESIRKTVLEQIIPQVAGNSFVTEQANLIAASLAMLIDVQPYEDDYLRVELADLYESLAVLGIQESRIETPGRDQVQSEVRRLKQKQHEQLELLAKGNGGIPDPGLMKALLPYIERQEARELAWTRCTGFHPRASALPGIGDVLMSQRGHG